MTSPMNTDLKQRGGSIRLITSLVITAGILMLLLHRVQLGELMGALSRLGVLTLLLALVVSLVLNALQAAECLRWSLRIFGQRLLFAQALEATVSTLAPKMVLPGGLGVVVRVLYLHRVAGLDLAGVTMSLALIPWFKLMWMLVMPLAGFALGATVPTAALVTVTAALAVVLALTWVAPRGGLFLLDRLARQWPRLRRLQEILTGLGGQPGRGPVAITLIHAFISASLEVVLFAVVLIGVLGVEVDLVALLALFPLCALGSKIPVAFLGLGAREALVLFLFAQFGDEASLLAAALAYSAIGFLLPPLLAAPFTWRSASYRFAK